MAGDAQNPFADYGSMVHGDNFIGRASDLRAIENRIVRPSTPGNLSVVGLPRIGKSSLVHKALMERRTELASKRIVLAWLNVATFERTDEFFRSMVGELRTQLVRLGWFTEEIERSADEVFSSDLSSTALGRRVETFFELLKEHEIRPVLVLDEFDYARHLFKGSVSAFATLRDLGYRPECRIGLVAISRRTIYEIETQSDAISTLDGIFQRHDLTMFRQDDLTAYFRRLREAGVQLTTEQESRVCHYCGGSPFFLGMMGFFLVEMHLAGVAADPDGAYQYICQALIDQYGHITDLLREERKLDKLLQILFGPVVDVRQQDVEEFLRYGLIKPSANSAYVAFSDHFQAYLTIVERSTDLWPVWRDTELLLRHTVSDAMTGTYGTDWVDELSKRHKSLKDMFDKCKEAQAKEQRSFGPRASVNLIDFTYPADLFAIVFAEWPVFQAQFGHDKNYWNLRVQTLAKVRNPLAHNRPMAIQDHERQLTEAFCKEILVTLKK